MQYNIINVNMETNQKITDLALAAQYSPDLE